MCRRTGTFGPHAWTLPTQNVSHPTDEASIRYFARFFLEGLSFPKLKAFGESLLCRPLTFTKASSFHGESVKVFLKALAGAGNVDSVPKMEAAFDKDANFLKAEVKRLLPKARHQELDDVWPPLN